MNYKKIELILPDEEPIFIGAVSEENYNKSWSYVSNHFKPKYLKVSDITYDDSIIYYEFKTTITIHVYHEIEELTVKSLISQLEKWDGDDSIYYSDNCIEISGNKTYELGSYEFFINNIGYSEISKLRNKILDHEYLESAVSILKELKESDINKYNKIKKKL